MDNGPEHAAAPPLRIKASAFENLFVRALKSHAGLREALGKTGVDLDALADDYPMSDWHRCLDAAAVVCFPSLSASDADIALGRAFILGYEHTLLGSIMMAPVGLLRPGQLLDRYPRYAAESGTMASADVETIGERARRLHYRSTDGRPSFVAGMLLECLERTGTTAQVEVTPRAENVEITFTW